MTRPFSSRRFLLTAISGFALCAASHAQAADTPELQFHPSKTWTLSSEGMQCSARNSFNNGFVLSLNGTQNWVDDLHIDFKQDVFEAGKNYMTTLSVPGLESATIQAAGASSSTLKISLNEHVDLYKALRKNGVLDVDIESNRFRFFMTGFSGVAQNFERCMAGLSNEPQDDQAPVELSTSRFQSQSSEDPNARFTRNEAQEMEQQEKEKAVAVTEILPEDPQPVVQEIPYTEVTKVNDVVVEERDMPAAAPVAKETTEMAVDTMGREVAAETMGAEIPAERLIEAASAEPPAPEPVLIVEDTSASAAPARRMSEILAEQILNNPEIIEQGGGAFAMRPSPAKMAMQDAPAEESETPLVASTSAPVEDDMEPVAPSRAPIDLVETSAPEPAPLEPIDVTEVTPAPEAVPVSGIKGEPMTPIASNFPEPQPVAVKNVKTPEIQTHKEVIRAQADFTALEPAATHDYRFTDPEMSQRISELEKQVKVLKAENMSLNADLRESLQASEEERMTIASENWNLERATMRFNEAERQINRLGQQLQRERAKCMAEKQDLEAMLFDPQVTNDQQLARLADLETQLMEAKSEAQDARLRYEQRIGILEERLSKAAQ